ncbi:hypothetical protein HDU93_003600, partial [Gonapodya sp. JEL0774]
ALATQNKDVALRFLSLLTEKNVAKAFADCTSEDLTWEIRPSSLKQPTKSRKIQETYMKTMVKHFDHFGWNIASVAGDGNLVVVETTPASITSDKKPYGSDMTLFFTFDESGKIVNVREHVDSRYAVWWQTKGSGRSIMQKVTEELKGKL